MVEILFLCGSGKEATVATIGTERSHVADMSEADQNEVKILSNLYGYILREQDKLI